MILSYLSLSDGELSSCMSPLAGYHWGYHALDLASYQSAAVTFKRAFGALNSTLASRTFLLGDRVTVADICVSMTLAPFFAKVIDAAYTSQFPHVTRWFTTCINQPNFKKVMGTFEFCKQAEVVVGSTSSTAAVAVPSGVFGKIFKFPGEPKINRIVQSVIAAAYNGLKVDLVDVDSKSADYLAKFPLGKVPGFEGADGFAINESTSIARHIAASVADTTLLGSTKKEAALVEAYVATSEEFYGAQRPLLYPFWGYLPKENADDQAGARANVARHLAYLNTQLATRTFLVGQRDTLADIVVVCSLVNIFKHVVEPSAAAEYKNVMRWFNTCINQPQFKSFVQAPVFSKPVFTAKPAAAAAAPAPAGKKEKAPSAKKEEKPAKAAKKEEPAGEDLEAIAAAEMAKPKEKNPQGYSIWKCDYKYNDELTQIFMSSNLIGGFFQRLESARKYAFGSMLVLGTAGKSKITGYFVFRGLDVPFEVKDSADYESYLFTKIDHSKPAVREHVNAVFAWDEKVDGMACADGKTFK